MAAPFPIFPLETPAIRALEIMPVMQRGQQLLLVQDPLGLMEGVTAVAPDPLFIVLLQTADGSRTIDEIAEIAREKTGLIVTSDKVRHVVKELDTALMLLSDRLAVRWEERKKSYHDLTIRETTVFKTDDRLMMIKQLGDEFRRHRMSRQSPPDKIDLPNGNVRAILAPHIDYMRGGEAYAWAYKALADNTRAKTFIILGTLHRPATHLYIASDKTYRTPLGDAEVDKALLEELKAEYPHELFEEEYLHAHEHTIELQVVYLQHVLQGRSFKILPILVAPIDEYLFIDPPVEPSSDPETGAFVRALRKIMEKHGDDVVLIGGVDFSHCGPEFGDEQPNTPEREAEIRAADEAMLKTIEAVDPKGFFDGFRPTGNDRKVCSVAAIYTVLAASGIL